MSQYDQTPTDDGKLLTEDNQILDLQEFMESGAIIATAVGSATPVTPIGDATVPTYEQITPQAKKFINSLNEVYDLLAFLQSGNLKVQVIGGGGDAPSTATYITATDETATLPNSYQLLGTVNQIDVTNGVLSLADNLIFPGLVSLGGHFYANGYAIAGGSGTSLDFQADTSAEFDTPFVSVNALRHRGESTNKILFGTGNQQFLPDNNLRMELSANGMQLGNTGAIIASFSDDGTFAANSSTISPTQKASKTYTDSTQTIIKAASYLTSTNETALLPNSQPLSALPTGFMAVTTATGIVNSRVLTQTANQIDITNADGLAGNPAFSLASVLITPGSLQAGTTFNVAGTVAIDAITNSSSSTSATAVMTASAVQAAIAAGVVSGKSLRGGWDASSGLYPATGGSGVGGAVAVGDWWYITVAGTVGANPVQIGDHIVALVNAPGQTDANWFVVISKVDSVFGRVGDVLAQYGDYSFSLISGTAAVSQGGTGNTSVGANGTFAYSDGSKYVFSPMAVPLTAGSSGTYWRSNGTDIVASAIQVADVPTLNQNTSGQAGSVANAVTFNNAGSGDASGATFNGSAARTISHNTIGASPLAGSTSIITVGTIATGQWDATAIGPTKGGTGLTSPGPLGNVLTSDGAGNWTSSAPASSTTVSGCIWMNTGNWSGQNFAFTTSYKELTSIGTNFSLAGDSSNFAMTTDGRLKYTGAATIPMRVSASVILEVSSGSFAAQLYKNGVAIAGSEVYVQNQGAPIILGFPVASVATNDYFSVWVKRSASNTNAIMSVSLSAAKA